MTLGSLLQSIEQSLTINDAKEKVQKIRYLINMGKYDVDLAKYIPGLTNLAIQGMLDDIDTKGKVAHPSYEGKEQLDFQILLTENYYVNPASIHICFPIKIKKKIKQQQRYRWRHNYSQ